MLVAVVNVTSEAKKDREKVENTEFYLHWSVATLFDYTVFQTLETLWVVHTCDWGNIRIHCNIRCDTIDTMLYFYTDISTTQTYSVSDPSVICYVFYRKRRHKSLM